MYKDVGLRYFTEYDRTRILRATRVKNFLAQLRVLVHPLTRLTSVHFSVAQQPRYDPGIATSTMGSLIDIQPLRRIQTTERFVEQLAVDGDDAIVLHPDSQQVRC